MRRTHFLIITGLLLCVASPAICQQVANDENDYGSVTLKKTLPNLTRDFTQMVAFPARMNTRTSLLAAGYIAATAGLMITLDDNISDTFNHDLNSQGTEATRLLTGPGRLFDRIGPDIVIMGTGAVLVGSGFLMNDVKIARTGWTAMEALLFTQLTTGLLKFSFGRNRPFITQNSLRFDPAELDNENQELSMPSGHTARAFAFSTVLASSFDSYLVKVPAYALAASVAVQRISSNEHWASDVLVGGTIGYMIGKYVSRRNGISVGDHQLKPLFASGKIGFSLKF